MAQLGVNIDHVATVREARKTYEPDPVWAAALAELGGADGITLHLREDRRHIQDRDLIVMKETVSVKLNLELACETDVLRIACEVKRGDGTNGTFNADEWVDAKDQRRYDTFIVLAIAAAGQAMKDSGWVAETYEDQCRTGVLVGSVWSAGAVAVGVSLAPVIVIVSVEVSVPPSVSCSV